MEPPARLVRQGAGLGNSRLCHVTRRPAKCRREDCGAARHVAARAGAGTRGVTPASVDCVAGLRHDPRRTSARGLAIVFGWWDTCLDGNLEFRAMRLSARHERQRTSCTSQEHDGKASASCPRSHSVGTARGTVPREGDCPCRRGLSLATRWRRRPPNIFQRGFPADLPGGSAAVLFPLAVAGCPCAGIFAGCLMADAHIFSSPRACGRGAS